MKYEPHILHHVFPFIAILVTAIACYLFPGWQTILALIVISIISIIISLQIVIAQKTESETRYWMEIGRTVSLLSKAEPEIWEALGFKNPPRHATLEITRMEQTSEGMKNPYYTTEYMNVPVSPAVLQVFADGILSGRKKLSEGSWKGIIPGPKFREFQDWMERYNLIAKVNPEAATQGYILTEPGEKWLLRFASQSITVGGYVRKVPVKMNDEMVRNHHPI